MTSVPSFSKPARKSISSSHSSHGGVSSQHSTAARPWACGVIEIEGIHGLHRRAGIGQLGGRYFQKARLRPLPSLRIKRMTSARIFAASSSAWPWASRMTIFAAFSRSMSIRKSRWATISSKISRRSATALGSKARCHSTCALAACSSLQVCGGDLQRRDCVRGKVGRPQSVL